MVYWIVHEFSLNVIARFLYLGKTFVKKTLEIHRNASNVLESRDVAIF